MWILKSCKQKLNDGTGQLARQGSISGNTEKCSYYTIIVSPNSGKTVDGDAFSIYFAVRIILSG